MTRPRIPTILNVEDYAISREATSEILRNAGYHVIGASTGAETLRLVEEIQPHLILLDVKLPDMSGYDVCKRLKSQHSTRWIPIVHVSGSYVNQFDKVKGLEGGADGYLVKPVNSAELIATINAFLRIREAEVSVRESEERLRIALDAAQMGAWECTVSTGEVSMDARTRAIVGVGDSALSLMAKVHPDDRERAEATIADAVRSRGTASLEFRMKGDNGRYRWLEANAQVKTNYDDQVMRLAGVLRDIGDRKSTEEEREELLQRERDARADAEAANRARDEFLTIVAHELRSPLNAVLGWAQILQRGKYSPKTLEHAIEIIESSARSQQKLIEDLLDSARIVSGKLRLEIQAVDLTRVVEAALETVRPAADLKRVSLAATYGRGIDRVKGDAERLQQVVWNLLSNAVKFTPEGGSVRVSLDRTGDSIRLSVEDTGAGIKPEFLPFIFDRFLQAEGAAKRQSGLGLGLALVRHLVQLHRGAVRAESPGEGLGSTFIVTLPLGESTASLRAVRINATGISGLSLRAALDKLRILVVDDDDDSRELVKIILEQHGAEVTEVNSALAALAIIEDKSSPAPDCLVSDIGMPDHSGYWLIGKIRERQEELTSALPAIALTSFASADDRVAALTAGFQKHVAKPLDPSELVMAIASLVGRESSNDRRQTR
jgi:PAS domain S-box-containing protein